MIPINNAQHHLLAKPLLVLVVADRGGTHALEDNKMFQPIR
jgi:hypothetical protein